jgi:hypothetical protein
MHQKGLDLGAKWIHPGPIGGLLGRIAGRFSELQIVANAGRDGILRLPGCVWFGELT